MPSDGTIRLVGAIGAFLVASAPALHAAAIDDPWPFWGRTPQRTGNTPIAGPRTSTIEWSLLVGDTSESGIMVASCTMDKDGRLFVGRRHGITVVDAINRTWLWRINGGWVSRAPSLWNGYVLWGEAAEHLRFFCAHAVTGEVIWQIQAEDGNGWRGSPVVDENGIAYFSDALGLVYAVRIVDGEVLWTTHLDDFDFAAPTLDDLGGVLSSRNNEAVRLDIDAGDILWTFPTHRELLGLTPYVHSAFYLGSCDANLYAVEARTGDELWRFDAIKCIEGVAVARDGTIHCGTIGGQGFSHVYAVNPDGTEQWDFTPPGLVTQPPLVDTEGTVYVSSWASSPRRGWVIALNGDGSVLWMVEFDDLVVASPMLAPDGTLYILGSDNYLYAFRDPSNAARLVGMEIATGQLLDGGVANLWGPDDVHVETRSGFGETLSDLHKMELIVHAATDVQNAATLDITIESRLIEHTGTARVYLRNWSTDDFEQVGQYPIGPNDETVTIVDIDAGKFVNLDGQIDLQLKHVVFVPFLAFRFESFIDYVLIEVN